MKAKRRHMQKLSKRNYRVEALLSNSIADAEMRLRNQRRNRLQRRQLKLQQNKQSQAQSCGKCNAPSSDSQPDPMDQETTQVVSSVDPVQQRDDKITETPGNQSCGKCNTPSSDSQPDPMDQETTQVVSSVDPVQQRDDKITETPGN
jgi:hypothetical protein